MKRITTSLFIVAASFTITPAIAEPITHPVSYICPSANSLGNFGSYIAGFGYEILSARTTSTIYFQSTGTLYNIPDYLANYRNSGTSYDGPTGYVACQYSSTNPVENEFQIFYKITNGKGGQVQAQTNNTISVLFFVG